MNNTPTTMAKLNVRGNDDVNVHITWLTSGMNNLQSTSFNCKLVLYVYIVRNVLLLLCY